MKYIYIILAILLVLVINSCGKEFLDEKPSKRTRVPNLLEDYGALLDNTNLNAGSTHALGMIGGDEYYLTDVQYNTFPDRQDIQYQKNAYTWNNTIYLGGDGADWTGGYANILVCNVIMDGLKRIKEEENRQEYNRIKGSTHFFRALNYYNLAQLFCPVYDQSNLDKLGLPIRKEADITLKVNRSSIAETYEYILSELEVAERLLPEQSLNVFRPTKSAVNALKVRFYLQTGEYDKALNSCENILKHYNSLIDFNTLNQQPGFTFVQNGVGNPEIFFYSTGILPTILANNSYNIDSVLFTSYYSNDLRGHFYFKNNQSDKLLFMGSYSGSFSYFTGFAVDEILLHQAECYARINEGGKALQTLNKLRKHRIQANAYSDLTSSDSQEILKWVLEEKKKELVLRGVRWEELRRLNKENKFKKTLTRKVGNMDYELVPDSKKWTWPLPLEAIQSGGYIQNER